VVVEGGAVVVVVDLLTGVITLVVDVVTGLVVVDDWAAEVAAPTTPVTLVIAFRLPSHSSKAASRSCSTFSSAARTAANRAANFCPAAAARAASPSIRAW
jgi:hypothetical protein